MTKSKGYFNPMQQHAVRAHAHAAVRCGAVWAEQGRKLVVPIILLLPRLWLEGGTL